MASSSSLDNLVRLVASSAKARYICAVLVTLGDGEKLESAVDRFRHMFVKSPHAAAAINAFANDLDSTKANVQQAAVRALAALAFRNISNSRVAAEVGAVKKLVKRLQRGSADPEVMRETCCALNSIVVGSTNRAQRASKAGVIMAVSDLLVPATPAATINAAAILLFNLITFSKIDLPKDPRDTARFIERLANVLVRADSSQKTQHYTCAILIACSNEQNGFNAVTAAALAKARAVDVLAQLASSSYPAALPMLAVLVKLHPEHAEAAVRAGAIDIAMRFLRASNVLMRSSAGVMFLALEAAGQQYAAKLDRDTMDAIGSAFEDHENSLTDDGAKEAACVSACAGCGAAKGSGKDGALQQCSACQKVVYCSRECQKKHWKVHKPHCLK